MSYGVPGRFSVFPLWWGGSIWRAMKKKGRVRSGGQAIVVRATTRITTGRIVARATGGQARIDGRRSEEHTSELQSLMRISYAVFCLKKKKTQKRKIYNTIT